jgi:hypothetical protein
MYRVPAGTGTEPDFLQMGITLERKGTVLLVGKNSQEVRNRS